VKYVYIGNELKQHVIHTSDASLTPKSLHARPISSQITNSNSQSWSLCKLSLRKLHTTQYLKVWL